MVMFAEEELFYRDLAEVHLLMDHISGRPDKSLSCLDGKLKSDSEGNESKEALSAQKVVEGICRISYPPHGTQRQNAQQAAFMLAVKDELNRAAEPAKGLTVAFTLMFSGISVARPASTRWMGALRRSLLGLWSGKAGRDGGGPKTGGPVKEGGASKDGEGGGSHGHRGLYFSAQAAYPNLERPARKFRREFSSIPIVFFLIILAIAYLNWDAGITSGLLAQVTSAETDYAKLYSPDRLFVPTEGHCRPYRTPTPAAPPPPAPAGEAVPAPAPDASGKPSAADVQRTAEQLLCRQATLLSVRQASELRNLRGLVVSARGLLGFVIHPIAFWVYEFQPEQTTAEAEADQTGVLSRLPLEDTANAVLHAFNVIIMPMLFGWLGTLVGVARSVTSKVRDSTLAPRDHMVVRVSVVLGMSAGLAVGLIFNPDDPNGALSKQFGGAISISAASLSFLAGLGAETFFRFLDQMIGRVFTLPGGATSGTIAPVRPSDQQPKEAAS